MRWTPIALGLGLSVIFAASAGAFENKPRKSRLFLPQVKPTTIVKGDEIYKYPPYARGKKGRKYIRRFSLRENIRGDKLEAMETYGYTPHRLRFLAYGKITERWRWYSLGLEMTFDEEGNLLSKHHFPPESGHID